MSAMSVIFTQQENQVDLGILQIGATVSFVHSSEGDWGIKIYGSAAPSFMQQKPAQIEIFKRNCKDRHTVIQRLELLGNKNNKKWNGRIMLNSIKDLDVKIGNDLIMKFNLKIFTGNKFCLFNYATKETGGYVDFDWFRTSAGSTTFASK